MNLGSANLKAVNTSTPQLLHSGSKQSVAASDDYYSLNSEYASDRTSNSPVTAVRYATPPSRSRSKPASKEQLGLEMTPPNRSSKENNPLPLNVRFDESSVQNRPTSLAKAPGDSSPPTPGVDDTPYLRFAIDQLTRDEELLGHGRHGSVVSADYPVDRIVPDEGLEYYSPGAPRREPTREPRKESEPREERESIPREPEYFVVAEPPEHCHQYPRTTFLPLPLTAASLVLTIIICCLIIAGLIFCNIYSLQHHGLWHYTGVGGPRYFVFQFMPQLLGVFVVLWIFVVQAAVYRIIPFCIMASARSSEKVLQELPILPANFLFPDFRHFRHGEPLVGLALSAFWVTNFTIPLLSCAFQTTLYNINGAEVWRWASVQEVVWVLVGLYTILVVALVLLLMRFIRSKSGLMWDPVCLADLIPIFQRTNILPGFDGSEISGSIRTHIPQRSLRVGYWTTSRGANTFYAVGEENASMRRYSMEHGRLREKMPTSYTTSDFELENQRHSNADSFPRNIHSPFVRYRWAPFFLRDTAVVAWIVTAIVLLIAFIVVSFVNSAVRTGFVPLLPTRPDYRGFSSSNFLYSFIPSLLGMFLFLAWQPIDTYFRAIQPFSSLSAPRGATAETSLLVAYPSCLPLEVTFLALMARHYKVAWISFISLVSLSLPVLAGGVFEAQYFVRTQDIRVSAYMPAYYALIALAILYALSFLVIWPTRKRYLPHKIHTLADLLSFLYQSPLLRDSVFREPTSKADLVTRLLVTPPDEPKSGRSPRGGPRYAFGIYKGRDNKEHLGIDRLQRPGSGEMLIGTGMMGRTSNV